MGQVKVTDAYATRYWVGNKKMVANSDSALAAHTFTEAGDKKAIAFKTSGKPNVTYDSENGTWADGGTTYWGNLRYFIKWYDSQ